MNSNLVAIIFITLTFCGCSSVPEAKVALDRPPKAVYFAPPNYPLELRKAGITGDALVELIVSSSGETVEVHAVSASHPLFAAAAVEAVRRCKYEPGYKFGKPVNTRMQVPLHFDLN
jgi:protein TonB